MLRLDITPDITPPGIVKFVCSNLLEFVARQFGRNLFISFARPKSFEAFFFFFSSR